jgi:hypothetical protein
VLVTVEPRVALTAIVARALLYALAVTALVLYAPGGDYRFIYQGF